MGTQFLLKVNASQAFYFQLVDDTGEVLLIGGEYPLKQDAEKNIEAVRVGSLMGNQLASAKTASGQSFFVITNPAGEIIAKSQLFSSQMSFDNALHQVKDKACIAAVTDKTLM